jgi:hypothetical protein
VHRSSNLSVLMNKKDGSFLIRNYAIDPRYGYRAEFGEMVPVDAASMRARGLDIILANLEGFFERDALKDLERPRKSREENLRIDRDHYDVGVSLSGDTIGLEPTKRFGGGFVGIPRPDFVLDAGTGNDKFFEVLMEAFAVCRDHDASRRGRRGVRGGRADT